MFCFMICFCNIKQRTGIEYLPGGVASGFNKMEKDVYRTRLLQVKGKRVVRSYEVQAAEGGCVCVCGGGRRKLA